jgi:hypothetical protein
MLIFDDHRMSCVMGMARIKQAIGLLGASDSGTKHSSLSLGHGTLRK